MGWVETRYTTDGTPRYVAKYRDIHGRKQTAGTFSTEKKAEKAWQAAEVHAGRQRFKRYVEEVWLPHHVMEASTREGYTYQIARHIMPWFGGMKMVEILPSDVREWVTHLKDLKVVKNEEEKPALSPATIQNLRNILSAIFTTALNDQVIFFHPCKGVKTPTVPTKPPVIISPEQFDAIYEAMPEEFRLLVEPTSRAVCDGVS